MEDAVIFIGNDKLLETVYNTTAKPRHQAPKQNSHGSFIFSGATTETNRFRHHLTRWRTGIQLL